MFVYCYRCRTCGTRAETTMQRPWPHKSGCSRADWVRDYRAEAASPCVSNLAREREFNGTRGAAELFLPTLDDFKSPEDPEGTKGMRDWADRHGPRDTNKRPVYPEGLTRKSF